MFHSFMLLFVVLNYVSLHPILMTTVSFSNVILNKTFQRLDGKICLGFEGRFRFSQ